MCFSQLRYKTVKQREEKYNYRELPRTPVSARSNTSGCLSLSLKDYWNTNTVGFFSLKSLKLQKFASKLRTLTFWRLNDEGSNRWIIKERLLKLCAFKLFISFYKQIKQDSSVKWACLPLSHPGQQFRTKCNGLSRNAQMEALGEATFHSQGWSNFNPKPIIGKEKNCYE